MMIGLDTGPQLVQVARPGADSTGNLKVRVSLSGRGGLGTHWRQSLGHYNSQHDRAPTLRRVARPRRGIMMPTGIMTTGIMMPGSASEMGHGVVRVRWPVPPPPPPRAFKPESQFGRPRPRESDHCMPTASALRDWCPAAAAALALATAGKPEAAC
jgi:hypothetical protein